MKLVRFGSVLLALAMALCIFAGCGKGTPELSKPKDRAFPTEFAATYQIDGAEVSITTDVAFAENQLTLTTRATLDGEPASPEPEKTIFLLDEYGNVVREIRYRRDGTLKSVEDYVYAADGRVIRSVSDDSYSDFSTGGFLFVAYAYEGDAVKREGFYAHGPENATTRVRVYDENGRLVTETNDSFGWTRTYTYDEQGNLVKDALEGADNETSLTEYKNEYSDGRLTKVTSTYRGKNTYTTVGKYETVQMTEGQYRCAMLLAMHQDPEMYRGGAGGSGEVRYADGKALKDAEVGQNGKPRKETYYLPDGSVQYTCEYAYDGDWLWAYTYRNAQGEPLLALNSDIKGKLLLSNDRLEYEFDSQGNVSKKTVRTANGEIDYVEEYDKAGEVAKKHDYTNGRVSRTTVYEPEAGTYTYTDYREDGSVGGISVRDIATGRELQHTYCYEDGARETTEYDPATGARIKNTGYDENGVVRDVTEYDPATDKTVKHTWYYESGEVSHLALFDGDGNFTEEITYKKNGAVESSAKHEHDANGVLTKSVYYDGDGNMTRYTVPTYDAWGNTVKQCDYLPDGSLFALTEWTFDENGNLLTEDSYTYDGQGNVTWEDHWSAYGD